jgi:hypothetical protein
MWDRFSFSALLVLVFAAYARAETNSSLDFVNLQTARDISAQEANVENRRKALEAYQFAFKAEQEALKDQLENQRQIEKLKAQIETHKRISQLRSKPDSAGD